jgi:NAD(P)-dependent dehydrogenase (short-subunit alcohol dehydrogenase family)
MAPPIPNDAVAAARSSCSPPPILAAPIGQVQIKQQRVDVKASKQLLESLPAHASVHFEHADLRDIGALRRAVASVREAFGPITILVNNAGRDDHHAIEDVTPEFWDERIAVNLKHQFFGAQAVAPDMIQAGGRFDRQHGLGELGDRPGQHALLHHRQVRGSGPDPCSRRPP